MKNRIIELFSVVMVLCIYFSIFSINAFAANAVISGFDLVDSNKHCDYDANQSSYESYITTAVQKWNNYKAGILRADTILTIQDVKIIDTNSSNVIWAGKTEYMSARIQLNSYYLNNSSWNYNNRLKTVMHELGHALGLGENNYSLSTNVMKQGKSENTTLTVDDKASYDLAYTYY